MQKPPNLDDLAYDVLMDKYGHVNLSVNPYVKPELASFKDFTYQTVLQDDEMTIENIKRIVNENKCYTTRYLQLWS